MAVVDLTLVHQVLLELAEEQLGPLEHEAVARASDEPWKTSRYTIDPHLLNPALHQLVRQGRLGCTTEVTRGGRPIPIYHPFDLSAVKGPSRTSPPESDFSTPVT